MPKFRLKWFKFNDVCFGIGKHDIDLINSCLIQACAVFSSPLSPPEKNIKKCLLLSFIVLLMPPAPVRRKEIKDCGKSHWYDDAGAREREGKKDLIADLTANLAGTVNSKNCRLSLSFSTPLIFFTVHFCKWQSNGCNDVCIFSFSLFLLEFDEMAVWEKKERKRKKQVSVAFGTARKLQTCYFK